MRNRKAGKIFSYMLPFVYSYDWPGALRYFAQINYPGGTVLDFTPIPWIRKLKL